jgi:succinate dehydrogenase/fumarate reductase flavoprotein subunit
MAEEIQCEVLVVGGGASGVPAAIAASRSGAHVVLLEEDDSPGGAPTDNFITYPCGNPKSGIYREMILEIDSRYRMPSRMRESTGRREEDWYLPFGYSLVINEMLKAESDNLQLLCGIRAHEPLMTRDNGTDRVCGVLARKADGQEVRIKAHTTIDATGRGTIAYLAGCQEMYGRDGQDEYGEPLAPPKGDDKVQQVTLMFFSQRLGTEPFDVTTLRVPGMIDAGFGWVKKGPEEFVARDTGFYLHWGIALECADTRDEQLVAAVYSDALEAIRPDIDTLWQHQFFVYTAPRLGIRETRRIRGEYVLTEQNLRSGVMPEDVIALGHHHVDLWGHKLTEEERQIPVFGIPYRCLLPRGMDGLLLAGKVISCSHIGLGPARVQPTVAAAGQAAGVAAAQAVARKAQVSDVNVSEVQAALQGPGQNLCLEPENLPDEPWEENDRRL